MGLAGGGMFGCRPIDRRGGLGTDDWGEVGHRPLIADTCANCQDAFNTRTVHFSADPFFLALFVKTWHESPGHAGMKFWRSRGPMKNETENQPPAAPRRSPFGATPGDTAAVLADLLDLARRLGASDAAVVAAAAIVADEGLARFCLPPGCPHHGRSAGCPPHVKGPRAFREQLTSYRHALLFRIDASVETLRSARNRKIFSRLHRIAAGVERGAMALGCPHARAFAGGSCRSLFCADQTSCRVVDDGGACRHPASARPSLSGYGGGCRSSGRLGRMENALDQGHGPSGGPLGRCRSTAWSSWAKAMGMWILGDFIQGVYSREYSMVVTTRMVFSRWLCSSMPGARSRAKMTNTP